MTDPELTQVLSISAIAVIPRPLFLFTTPRQ